MNQQIIIQPSELIEFAGLMDHMASGDSPEEVHNLDPDLLKLGKEAETLLSKFLRSELAYYVKELRVQQMIFEAVYFQGIKTLSDWFDHLKSLDLVALEDLYLMGLIERTSKDKEEEILQDISEDDYLSSIGFDVVAMADFRKNLAYHKDRLVFFMEAFYHDVFLKIEAKIMAMNAETCTAYQKVFDDNPDKFIRETLVVDGEGFIKNPAYEAIYFPCVTYPHHATFTMRKNHPEKIFVFFGAHVHKVIRARNSEAMMKMIGEPTKMAVLKLLAQGPAYASDLAKKLSLNRATMTHHLYQLVTVGAITIAYSKGNKVYYRNNIETIKEQFGEFLMLLGSGEVSHE